MTTVSIMFTITSKRSDTGCNLVFSQFKFHPRLATIHCLHRTLQYSRDLLTPLEKTLNIESLARGVGQAPYARDKINIPQYSAQGYTRSMRKQ